MSKCKKCRRELEPLQNPFTGREWKECYYCDWKLDFAIMSPLLILIFIWSVYLAISPHPPEAINLWFIKYGLLIIWALILFLLFTFKWFRENLKELLKGKWSLW